MLLVREVLGADPDEKQEEILRAVCQGERRIAVRSGHGVGKSTVLAWCIICHLLTRFPQKCVCTAPTSSQLYDALAAETKSWLKKLPPAMIEGPGRLIDIKVDSVVLAGAPDESFVSFRTSRPETPEALAGVHSENVLLIGDEASGIPEQVFEAAIGSMSGHSATTVLAGNPVRTSGTFFDVFNKPEVAAHWRRIHISCVGHPRVIPDFVADVARKYGEDSNAYRVRVLGEFPKADDDTVIPFELAEAARSRDVQPTRARPIWGLDVARFGSDRSALCVRRGNTQVGAVQWWQGIDTMQVAGRVKAKWDETPEKERPETICVDVIGYGAGVCDRLAELGLPALGINVAESPALGDKYRNLRSELWFAGREWLEKRDCRIDDAELSGELVKPKYSLMSNGKMQVESKDEMKKRGLRSPDLADAFLLTFAAPATTALHGGRGTSWAEPIKRLIKGIV